MVEIGKGKCPLNTERSTKRAVKAVQDRIMARNSKCPDDRVPHDFLEQRYTDDAATLCKWLSRFVVEAWRVDGQHYLPSTLYSLLAGVLCYM